MFVTLLSCGSKVDGHYNVYWTKPKVGDISYCVGCGGHSKIIEVYRFEPLHDNDSDIEGQ